MSTAKSVGLSAMVGKTLCAIGTETEESTSVMFECTDGVVFHATARAGSMEMVYLDRSIGDFKDILDAPIVSVEEVCGQKDVDLPTGNSSLTVTLWELRTANGRLVLVWHGESDGGASLSPYLYEHAEMPDHDALDMMGICFWRTGAAPRLAA